MSSPAREWGARLFLLAISTVMGLAGMEVAARALVWNWAREPGVVRHPFARFDPDLGWSKPPNAAGILRRSEYRVPLQINSFGLRGPEIPLQKPKGVLRVLLLGDSFAEGYTVEEPLSVRARVEKGLASALSTPVQVINGGTAGWGTDQEVLFYEKSGSAFAPDLVVLLFYYNDLYRDGDLRIQPWFDVDETGALVLHNSPVPPHKEFYRAEPFAIKPFHRSMALALLQPRLDSHPRVAQILSLLGLADPPPLRRAIPEEFHPFGRQRPREVRRHWERTQALLRRLGNEVSKSGARLMVFYVPARFEVDDAAWALTRELYGFNSQWDRNRVADELGRITGDLDLPFVDPRAAFRSEEARGAPTYFPEDGHWTEAGNQVASTEILAAIRNRSLLPAPEKRP